MKHPIVFYNYTEKDSKSQQFFPGFDFNKKEKTPFH